MAPNSKIKVVIGLPSLGVGGIEKHVLKQLRHFDTNTFEFHLITLFDRRFNLSSAPNLYDQISTHVHVHKMDFMGIADGRSWIRLCKELRSIRPDVVMSSMFFPNAVFRILKPLFGYKSIAREHNTYTDRRLYHRIADYLLSFLSFAVIGVSQGVQEYLHARAWIPYRKIHVIYNSVDLEEIRAFVDAFAPHTQDIRQSLGFAESEKIVIHVGRLKKQKNQRLLIDAFDVFAKDNPHHVLAVVGRGAEGEDLEKYARSKTSASRIRFFGHREDVYMFYLIADFFVLTSTIEGFAIVGIEAMAFGLPVVSTKVAGPDEYIQEGKNGYLVAHTVSDVARAMTCIAGASAEERVSMKETATTTASHFSIEENVHAYEVLFKEAIGQSHI